MALKSDRQIDAVEIGFYLNETASPGVVVSVSTAGSGIAMDSQSNVATVAANSSGYRPLGILLNEFVNVDLTRQPINWHKDQAQIGSKATILTKGWIVTDKITGTPVAGDVAALSSSGTVTPITPAVQAIDESGVGAWSKLVNQPVGRFRSTKNEDGYAKVYVDL